MQDRTDLPDSRDDPVRLRVGKRQQNYGIDHAENCRAGANTQCQSEDRIQCEAGIARDLPQSKVTFPKGRSATK
jgi:hypothetical protein